VDVGGAPSSSARVGDRVLDVCVAEDDDDIRGFIALILQKAGFRTEQHCDGGSALESARSRPAALYLLDVRMPGTDGLELCRQLRSDPTTRDSHILLMSAETTPRNVEAGMAAGADGYLPKPFSRKELLRRVNLLLGPPDSPNEGT
jgi:DNA-binding response OmpR family regulator